MFRKIKELYVDNRIWIQPIKFIVISFLISVLTILIDTRTIPGHEYIPEVLLTSVDLAKEILSTLSGALLTMTTFTFSTIMIVLTTYSSDFTPRVVENFLTDDSTTKVLGVFVGGFFYCITSLFFMRNALTEYSILAATIAIIYSVVCIFYFISFVYSVSASIQVSKLVSRLYKESSEVIDRAMNFRAKHEALDEKDRGIYKSKSDIYSQDNGYLEEVKFDDLMEHTKDMTCKVVIKERIGQFVSKNQIIATIYYNDSDISTSWYKSVTECFVLEEERSVYSDYNFSMQKIAEIALRAISPGINDPNTAIQCIRILGVLVGKLSESNGGEICIAVDDSSSKIIYKDMDLKKDIYYTFYQIVHYGKEDISVVLALFEALNIVVRKTNFKNINIVKEFSNYIFDSTIESFRNKIDIEILREKNYEIQNM